MSVVVLLEIQVKPEALNEMKAFLKKILPDTRAYDGCQGLDVYGNLDTTGNLVLYERWDSRQHYEKYLAWRSETGVVNQLGAMLARRRAFGISSGLMHERGHGESRRDHEISRRVAHCGGGDH